MSLITSSSTNHYDKDYDDGEGKRKGPRDVVDDVSLVIGMFFFAFYLFTFTN